MKCPFCAETVKSEAKKCKHCGEWLVEPERRTSEVRIEEPIPCDAVDANPGNSSHGYDEDKDEEDTSDPGLRLMELGILPETDVDGKESEQDHSLRSCAKGSFRFLIQFSIVSLLLGLVVWSWYSSDGGPRDRNSAVDIVSRHSVEIHLSGETKQYSVEELIQQYDPEQRGLGGLVELAHGSIKWRVEFGGGRYIVSCMHENRLYSFETDLTTVRPLSQPAQQLFDLQYSSFEKR